MYKYIFWILGINPDLNVEVEGSTKATKPNLEKNTFMLWKKTL